LAVFQANLPTMRMANRLNCADDPLRKRRLATGESVTIDPTTCLDCIEMKSIDDSENEQGSDL